MESAQRRIRVLVRHPDGGTSSGGMELLDAWRDAPECLIWVDFQGPADETEREVLEDRFGIDPELVVDARSPRHPPKVEPFDDYTFIRLRGLDAASDSIEFGTIQIALFVGQRWLISRHDDVSPSIDAILERAGGRPELLEAGTGALVARISRRVAERYLPIVLNLEGRLEEIEDEMFERPGDDILGELLVYKRQLKKLRRIATYHVNLFGRLRHEDIAPFDASLRHDLNEVWEQMERIVSLSTLYNDLANDLMNAYLSLSSHRLNHIMKVLTIVTVIFVPLTFVAGIYGMNFEHMPELASRWGYFVVLGTMTILALVLLYLFRRRGWL
jgi:magnesium transporter